MPLYDPTQRLAVGARFACLRCRLRNNAPVCPTCGAPALDLRAPHAITHVLRLALRARRRPRPEPGTARDERIYTTVAHSVAVVCALLGGLFGSRLNTGGFVAVGLVVALAAVLGFIGGYILTAMTAVLLLLAATFAAVTGSLLAGALALPVMVPALFLGPRGRAFSTGVERALGRTVRVLFAPVRSLRGMAPLDDAFDPGEPTGLRAPVTSASALRLPAPHGVHPTQSAQPVFEGVLAEDSGRVSLGSDLAGVIVGAAGTTLGTGVRDALVAPLVVRTDAGESVRVRLDVGEVRVRAPGRGALLGDAAPGEWGVPRRPTSRRGRRKFPAAQQVETWVVPAGARVRVEGGTLGEEAEAGPVDSYRSTRFVKTLVGTAESPVVLTVLDEGRA